MKSPKQQLAERKKRKAKRYAEAAKKGHPKTRWHSRSHVALSSPNALFDQRERLLPRLYLAKILQLLKQAHKLEQEVACEK